MAYVTVVFAYISGFFIIAIIANSNDVLLNGDYEFIDLTYPFDKNTVYWTDSQEFKFTKKIGVFDDDGFW